MLPLEKMTQTQRNGFNFGHGNGKVDFKTVTWNWLILYRTGACQNLVQVLGPYK